MIHKGRIYNLLLFNFMAHKRSLSKISLILSITVILLNISGVGPRAEKKIAADNISIASNYSYTFSTNSLTGIFYHAPADGPLSNDSTLSLYENGAELGPSKSLHADIANIGLGRFSHWQSAGIFDRTYVVFSASDNSDPRTNGRTYAVRYTPIPRPFVFYGSLLLFSISCRILWSCSFNFRRAIRTGCAFINNIVTGRGIVFLFSVYIFLVFRLFLPPIPILQPDSGSYLGISPAVSLGYPVFIHGIIYLTGSIKWIPPIQLIIFIGSVAYLYESLAKRPLSPILASFTAISILAYSPVVVASLVVGAESLFISMIIVVIAALARALDRPRDRSPMVVLGASAVAIVFIRPAGYFVIAAVLLIFLYNYFNARRFLIYVGLPAICLLGIGMGAGNLIRGTGTQSIAGLALFPHVAHLFEVEFVPPELKDSVSSVETVTKPYAVDMALQSNWEARYLFEAENFNPILHSLRQANDRDALDDVGPVAFNNKLRMLAIETILHRPIGYLKTVNDNILGAWVFCIFPKSAALPSAVLEAFTQQEEVFSRIVTRMDLGVRPYDISQLIDEYPEMTRKYVPGLDFTSSVLPDRRLLLYVVGALSLMAIPLPLLSGFRTPDFLMLSFVGALLHGAILLTATATVFIPRYGLPIDTILIVEICLGIGLSANLLRRAFRSENISVLRAWAKRKKLGVYIHRA